MNLLPFMAGLLGMGTVFFIIPLILKYSRKARVVSRSLEPHHTHKSPVPRLAGIALAVAFFLVNLATVVIFPAQAKLHDRLVIVGTSLAMFGLGLWDDCRPLGARRKLIGQVLIAAMVCCFGIGVMSFKIPFTGQIVDLGSWGILITIVWLVSMTNLINLIDGVDGLAGGISFMLMALLAYVGHQNGGFELLASGMAGALVGFLWFNFPPARIYLGDGGAYFLGFLIGLLALVGSQKGTVAAAMVAPLFVLALPIADMSLAILRRGVRGLPIFRPDRQHLHHRLLQMGFSRRKAVLSFYAVTMLFLLLGFLAFVSGGQLVPALLGITVLVLLLCAGQLNFSREWFAVGRVLGNSLEMRQEIQYALALTRWLALEGPRHDSLRTLWPNLVFVTQRLGFNSVTLSLADGKRTWAESEIDSPALSFRQELRGGHAGVLELTASDPGNPVSVRSENEDEPKAPATISNPKLFNIVSELVAEGWLKATNHCDASASAPLRFDSKRGHSNAVVTPAAGRHSGFETRPLPETVLSAVRGSGR